MKKKLIANIICLIGAFLLFLFDRLTKNIATAALCGRDNYTLIKGVFSLSYLENNGAAWGMFGGKIDFLVILTSVIVISIVVFMFVMPESSHFLPMRVVCGFVIAGAVGNLYDRIVLGHVVDFFYFELIDFPVFNVADCYIVCGFIAVVILIFTLYKNDDFSLKRNSQ